MQRHISRVFASVALVCVVAFGGSASALLIAHDDFDCATGSPDGQNGGARDWKDKWSGDSDITIATRSYSYTEGFSQLQLELNGTAGVDEIRVGDTFADVAPFTHLAPEPGTAAMLAAGLLGLGIVGRRRS